jgi:hypothetical protein
MKQPEYVEGPRARDNVERGMIALLCVRAYFCGGINFSGFGVEKNFLLESLRPPGVQGRWLTTCRKQLMPSTIGINCDEGSEGP